MLRRMGTSVTLRRGSTRTVSSRTSRSSKRGSPKGHFSLDADVVGMIEDEPDPQARVLLQESVGFLYKTGDSAEIEVSHLLTYLQSRQRQSLLCKRLPFTVVIFVTFTNMVLWHEDLSSAGLVQRELRGILTGTTFEGVQFTSGHKDFWDIQTTEDVYTFLREALLPLMLRADPEEVLRTGHPSELHRALRYNRLIGGVQLQQRRWGTQRCDSVFKGYAKTEAIVRGVTCFHDQGVDDCFGPMAFGTRAPGLRSVLPSGFCGDQSSEGYGQLFYVPQPAAPGSSAASNASAANASGAASPSPGSRRLSSRPSRPIAGDAPGRSAPRRPPRRKRPRRRRQGSRNAGGGAGRRLAAASAGGADARRLRMSAGHRTARAVTRNSPMINPSIRGMDSDTFSVLFTEEAGLPGALAKVDWLEDNRWIDLQTQWVGVNIFMLNPELAMYTHTTVSIYFGESGEAMPYIAVKTFHAEPYQSMAIIAVDVVFLILIVYVSCKAWGRLALAIWRKQLKAHLQRPWHWLRIGVSLGGILVIVLWITGYESLHGVKNWSVLVSDWMSRAIADNRAQQLAGQTAAQVALPGNMSQANSSVAVGMQLASLGDNAEYLQLLLNLHREVESFAEYVEAYRRVLAAYGILLLCNFIRLFQMQPRLAMLTNTIVRSWKDVAHHMVVFAMLWAAFAASGMMIFSRTVFAFGGFYTAITKTFTIMLGDLDWDELSEENPELAAAWLWVFLSLMTQLMLNMLMAIVMDVYGEVKSRALAGEPIWEQLHDMVFDWLQDRDEIGPRALERILKRIEKRQEVQKLSAKVLAHIVPGMSKEQAVELVEGALHLQEVTSCFTMTLSQMQRLIGHIHVEMQGVTETMGDTLTKMRAEIEENRELAARRKAEAARIAEEMQRLQAEERWEHSRRFQRRVRAIEQSIDKGERLLKDYDAWVRFRGKQAEDQVWRIEGLAREQAADAIERAEAVEGEQLDMPGMPGKVPTPKMAGSLASISVSMPSEDQSAESPQQQRTGLSNPFWWFFGRGRAPRQSTSPSRSQGTPHSSLSSATGSVRARPASVELAPAAPPEPVARPRMPLEARTSPLPASRPRERFEAKRPAGAAPHPQASPAPAAMEWSEAAEPSQGSPPQSPTAKARVPRLALPTPGAPTPATASTASAAASSGATPSPALDPADAAPAVALGLSPVAAPPLPPPPPTAAAPQADARSRSASPTPGAPPRPPGAGRSRLPPQAGARSEQEPSIDDDDDIPPPRLPPLGEGDGGREGPAHRSWLSAELEQAAEDLRQRRGPRSADARRQPREALPNDLKEDSREQLLDEEDLDAWA